MYRKLLRNTLKNSKLIYIVTYKKYTVGLNTEICCLLIRSSKRMKIAISCCTPYHIFNAVNLKVNQYLKDEVDIYICNHFNGSYDIYNRIKELNLFTNVYYVEDKTQGNFHRLKMILKYKLMVLNDDFNLKYKNNYEIIYIAAYSIFNGAFSSYLKNRNKTEVFFMEDGTSTYTIKKDFSNNIKNKLISFYSNELIDKYVLYNPSLSCVDYGDKILKMPELLNKKDMHKALASIFDVKDYVKVFNNFKVIYLDQKFDTGIDYETQHKLFSVIKDNISDDIIVKMHPREKNNKYTNKTIFNKTIPWELSLLIENLNDKNIFIAISSTAALANSIIFNNNTKVILLYKLVNYEEATGDIYFSKYIDKVKAIENLSLYVPETIEELKDILDHLNSNEQGDNHEIQQ